VLEKHGADLVLGGHEHHYERFRPVSGIHYIVTGGGGNGTRRVGAGPNTAFSESVLHFVYVDIQDSRLLLHAIDGAGSEFDSLRIDKTLPSSVKSAPSQRL
jgi:acid phosphatase